ncbi:MAG: TolC family protein [Desulfosalsimonas sp.]
MKRAWFALAVSAALVLLFCGTAPGGQQQGLTLKQAYGKALEENENIRISRQEMLQADYDITSASSGLYPQLSVRGAYNREKERDIAAGGPGAAGGGLSSPDEYGTLSLSLDQHIYQWGKLWSSRQMAKYYFEGSRLRHARQVQQLLYQVSVSFYEALLARRSIEIAETALNRAVWQAEQARARYEAGVITRTDVLRAEVEVTRSSEELERAKNDYDIALERLTLEMGTETPPDAIQEPDEKALRESHGKPEGL